MSGKGFDTRKLMTGKDGKLFITLDGVSIWFASVEEFTIGMNFSNVDFHPAEMYRHMEFQTVLNLQHRSLKL